MSTKKEKQRAAEADLNEFLEKAVPKKEFSPDLVFHYGLSALIASLAPAYVFYSIYSMDGVEYYPLFGVVTVIVGVLLALAYHNTNKNVYGRLMSLRPETSAIIGEKNAEKLAKAQANAEAATSYTSAEGRSFSILYNTLLFVGLFVLLGFFVLGNFLPSTFNYPVASVSAAALVMLSSRAK